MVVHPRHGRIDLRLDLLLVRLAQLAAHRLLAQRVAHSERVVLQAVLRLDAGLVRLVLRLELLGLLHHLLDLVRRQTALLVLDRDLVLLARRLLHRRHVQNAIRVNVERHLDLRHAARHRRNAVQVELAQQVVVLRHRPLALEHLDQHARLAVRVRREDLRLLRGDRRVARNQHRHHAARRLQTQRQRRHVQQQQVVQLAARALAAQHGCLHCRAVCHGLIRVDRLAQLLAVEELLQQLLHLRNTRRAAHQHHLVHLALRQLRVAQHLLHGRHRLAEVVHVQLLEARARDLRVEVDALEQRVDLDRRLRAARQRSLRALARRAQAAQGTLRRRQVLAELALELRAEVLHHAVIEVLTAQVRITRSGLHLENAVLNRQQRHIEGTATQIENQNVLLTALLVQTVSDSGRSGLVDDTHHVQSSNHSSVLRSLTLGVVEVGRHRNHSVLHLLAQIRLRNLLHLRQHHRRNLLGRERLSLALVLHFNHRLAIRTRLQRERPVLHVALHRRIIELTADQTLRVEHRVRGVHRHLVLRSITDQTLRIRERHVGRRRTLTLVVGNNLHLVVLPNTHTRVCGTQIDTNRFTSISLAHASQISITKSMK